MNTKATGDIGEQIAAEYLEAQGYRMVERNAVYGGCEVDIICEAYLDEQGRPLKQSAFGRLVRRVLKKPMKGKRTTVFCEVKTRNGSEFGSGLEAVTPYKVGRYVTAAKTYQSAHGRVGSALRFDIIEISGDEVRHITDAFTENDAKYPRNR